MNQEIFENILNAYPYEIIFVNCEHIVQWMNNTAKKRYGERVIVGNSLFNCHNEGSKAKIEEFLERARNGEGEMFELYRNSTGEREFFTPVKDKDGTVIGYFERHEAPWTKEECSQPVGEYWVKKNG